MKKYIKGTYKKSIYESDRGYIIGLFKVKETNDEDVQTYLNKTITFTGYFANLNNDDNYIFYGELGKHPKYGSQYQVIEYERLKPSDKESIISFLCSDLFKGIGEKLARNIVDILGDDCLDMIIDDRNCLQLIPKLSKKKADTIYNTLYNYDGSHKSIVYLTELGFSMQEATCIYNCYKDNTLNVIKSNLYSVLEKVEISFTKIDGIAKTLGVDPLDENRIKAGIIYIMKLITYKNGNTYLSINDIYDNICKQLKIDIDINIFKSYLRDLISSYKIVTDFEKYYLKEIFDQEIEIIKKVKILLDSKVKNSKKIDNYIENLEKSLGIKYNDEQLNAIKTSLNENITIITGGPGTGKTTIIKAIVTLYQDIYKLTNDELVNDIALLAPTGRASKRLSESTNLPASTIHRFLKWNKETNSFAVNEYDKDKSKLIIVDEVSMIDINLLGSLFKGLTDNIKLILVGDDNQLPSVGPGQILKDLINSRLIKTIKLNLLYRQKEDSYINILAEEIRNNSLSDTFLDTKSDYTFLECSSNNIQKVLTNLCYKINEKNYNYKNVQIMAPMYAGLNGIDELNKVLQKVFNKKEKTKNEIIIGDVTFRENDKILQLVNMPDDNVFNGDIGILTKIIPSSISESGKNEIYVDYDGNIVKYLPKDFNKIKHGYIISIHKSQGSEFDIVVLPISRNYKRMLYKKLIYTGITRAKKKLILIGEADTFKYSIGNDSEIIRKTSLEENLKKYLNKK
ncbi:MAG: ATP-dependent RecD-like DNA helicase [Bacilli bacterium]|nr:ATP-dependent RecD-like DNA helicase [Bacilli bacterium]